MTVKRIITRPVFVKDPSGASVSAKEYYCDHCGSRTWTIHVLDGEDHPHFECVSCKTQYCYGGACLARSAAEKGDQS